ncbi:MAG: hypothetical protein AB7U20_25490 [Planctomycetaceae bacterium]
MTQNELKAFYRFAMVMIDRDRVSSLDECLQLWRDDREFAETIAAIKESEEESAAGLTKTLDEVEAELRAEFGLQPRQPAS